MRLTLSYGGGIPSKPLSLSRAAAPLFVLWGTILQTEQTVYNFAAPEIFYNMAHYWQPKDI